MATYTRELNLKRYTDASGGVDVCLPKSMADLCHKLKQTVLDDLIDNEIVHEYARTHGIVISLSDFERQWAQVFSSKFHSNSAVLRDYAKGIGFTVSEVKDAVRDDMLQKAVLYRITRNMQLAGPATALSQVSVGSITELHHVNDLLKKGGSFDAIGRALAGKKGEACYQQACGTSLVIPDALIPPDQHEILTAQPGKIVGPYSSQTALTLIRVRAHYQKYQFTSDQLYSMRQQQFAAWLAQQVRRADVHRYATT
jgi:hypothetical protein